MFFARRHCSRGIFALILVSCAADANAQVTNCMDLGHQITCRTRNSGGVAKGLGDFISRTNDNAIRKRVGEMLAKGNCEGAARYAFSKGRLELGEQILRSCQTYTANTKRL